MTNLDQTRIVFVHDWLTGMRGGEKCLEALCRRFPASSLFTLLHRKGSTSPIIEEMNPKTSWLGKLPGVHRYYRYLLPFMPKAIESISIPPCDLVISLSHCVAKGVMVPEGTPHLCYCFTPARYAWQMRGDYFSQEKSSAKNWLASRILNRFQDWDRKSAPGVTRFIGISKTIQDRIWNCYQRESGLVYPPADTDFYTPADTPRENFYLMVSAFAPYKRLDLAVEACKALGRELVIVGNGQDFKRISRLAGPRTRLLGWQGNPTILDLMRRCKALLFPGFEDFGIVPVEAQACGAPVIALGQGGATETIIPPGSASEPTGWFFDQAEVESLVEAIKEFEARARDFNPKAARGNALRFSQGHFLQGMEREIQGLLASQAQSAAA